MRRCSREMPCEGCAVQFSVFRRRRACPECVRPFCAACLRRGAGLCAACRALCSRPLARHAITHLKPRDLQCFLQRQNVSTRGCVEKDELVDLCVRHVNSGAYRRRSGPGAGAGAGTGLGAGAAGAFSAFKGFTNNINELINNALDLRTAHPAHPAAPARPAHPAPPAQPRPTATSPREDGGCYNTAHAHAGARAPSPPRGRPRAPQPYNSSSSAGSWPGPPPPAGPASPPLSPAGPCADSADCFEIEDVDDAGWELVRRPAAPLPNDSEVLLAATDNTSPPPQPPSAPPPSPPPPPAPLRPSLATLLAPHTPLRAASELDLRRAPDQDNDTASLKDEPTMETDNSNRIIQLEELPTEESLQALTARQLKALLASNRVEYRGALEKQDLLRRAATLWRDHRHFQDKLEELPLEECCKICMAAPLECVLLECGHVAACTRCAKQLAECPICRQYVVRAVRFFRS